jgi:hypothetical protein
VPAGLTFSANLSVPLRGNYSFYVSTASTQRQGEGVSYDFTIDDADKNKRFSISFDLKCEEFAFAPGDIGLYVYDVDNSQLIYPSVIDLPDTTGSIQRVLASFNTTDSSDYRLIYHVQSTNAGITYRFDNVKVGPGEVVETSPESDWQDFITDPTLHDGGSGTELSDYTIDFASYKRDGDTAHIRVKASSSADRTDSDALCLKINDFTVTGDNTETCGTVFFDRGANEYNYTCRYSEDEAVDPAITVNDSTNSAQLTVGEFDNGDFLIYDLKLKVSEWAGSSAGLDNSRVEYAYNSDTANSDDTTSFAYGPEGAAIPSASSANSQVSKRVRSLSPWTVTDRPLIEVSPGNNKWFNAELFFPFKDTGSAIYGLTVGNVANSTDLDVKFGGDGATEQDAWSTYSS